MKGTSSVTTSAWVLCAAAVLAAGRPAHGAAPEIRIEPTTLYFGAATPPAVEQCFALTTSHTGSGGDPVASPSNSTGCPAGQYRYAEQIELTASPAAGWRVGGWTNTDADSSYFLINSLSMPASPVNVSVTYLEGLPSILLVYGDSSDLPYYTAALDALGKIYEVWDLDTFGSPDTGELADYPNVIWQAPYPESLNADEETALAAYLDGGGKLLFNSQQYLYYHWLTPFNQNYLGVGSGMYTYTYTVTGTGSALSGFGPFDVSFLGTTAPIPGPGAEAALENQDAESLGISKIGPNYRTIFLVLPMANLNTPDQRRDLLGAALEYLNTIFADVPRGYWAKKWIEAMYRNGITSGCSLNPRNYCPEGLVTRAQMAIFLLIAKEGPGYSPPPCASDPFNDVPASSPFCPWIQELANRGVTSGCGGGNYCPDAVVTRNQMSVFLLSTLEGPGYAPPACTSSSPFLDISISSPFCPWVGEIARRGITGGCGGGNFCPGDPVNRAQMAVFLITTFGLPTF